MLSLLFLICTTAVGFGIGLMLSIPTHLRQVAVDNCWTKDESWDWSAFRIELGSVLNVAASFAAMMLVLLAPLVLGVLVIHEYILPIPLLYELAELFSLDNFRERILNSNVPEAHEKFSTGRGLSMTDAHNLQRSLYRSWPFAVLLGVILLGCGYVLTRKMYVNILTAYRRDVLTRWAKRTCPEEPFSELPSLSVLEGIARQRLGSMDSKPAVRMR